MVRLREIPRSAAFAWSPGSDLPFIATGTKAGAVDADFSTETQLELWDLDLENVQQTGELKPAASVDTDSRFYDIAWGKAGSDYADGIIAGALENGSLDLWDAKALKSGQSTSAMSRTSKHSGAIKSLQFNPFRSELLATAGAKGELFISDLNNVANPFRLGTTSAARADDFESVDWNKKVPHILATGSSGGFVTVWDVKAKKESLTLNVLGRKAVSAVAWDPQNSTKLITAISDDSNPLILMWDLRNSNAPERTLKAHEQGVLSLSWCQQDSDLLLSCGKDNRLICWNPSSGQPYGEFPIVTNWTFQTRWNPHNPSLLATASFDGKIGIQTIQNTKPVGDQTSGAKKQPLDDEDFFNNAQSQPQGAAFSLPKPPKWLERPVGASFGFGGKLVSFGPAEEKSRRSKLKITHFAIDSNVGTATESFESSLKQGDFASICESKIAEAQTAEEKADWKVIETLLSPNPRKELIDYLGFSGTADEVSDSMASLEVTEGADAANDLLAKPNGTSGAKGHKPRLSVFFENSGEGDSFLSGLSATKGAKTNNPFSIYSGSESASEKQITKALMLGQFEKALDICLKEDKMSDAFMIAICGGQKCIDKAQAAYFAKQGKGPNFLRLLASVVGKNLWDVVYNAELSNWKEVMATLCTFADVNEFPDLCEALGDRLEEELKQGGGDVELRKDASFCYLAGSKLEKVVPIWIEELQESETAGLKDEGAESSFSVHAKSLQNLIEKVTVFREVTKFQDTERQQTEGWKLASLYDKYTEYADIVAAHGQLQVAEKYLDLLPPQYAAAEVARNRVKQASRKAAPQAAARQTTSASRAAQRPQQMMGGMPGFQSQQQQQQQQPMASTPSTASNPYAPVGAAHPTNPYAPTNLPSQPTGYQQGYQQAQQPQQQRPGFVPPPPAFGGYQTGPGVGAPPRQNNASPSVPPPSKATDMANWNDTPMVVKPPTSRRGTPGVPAAPITSPFPNQQNFSAPPPPGSPFGAQARGTPPPPPPPKAGSGPPPPGATGQQAYGGGPGVRSPGSISGPPSAAASAYAPQQASQPTSMAPPPATIPRGPSPYNAPPAGGPPSNRYAPAPAAPGYTPEQPQNTPPPGPARGGPPPNPYAQQQPPQQPPTQFGAPPPRQGAPSPYAPPQQQPGSQPPSGPPLGGLQGSRPSTAGSGGRAATPVVAAAPKHPAGDRSHISSQARPVYEILNHDMQRVKAKAPASFKAQVTDTEKRLNILFDHLNNDDLLKPDTVQSMDELAQALQARNYEVAQAIHLEVLTNKTGECGQWMVGVKRLIAMSRATP